ncbi:MAG: cytochrome-c oxidase, cbb3-type subunit I [Opitutaceae bacterium]|nr:cytochrome-c oxidase, cbb3-type subunit I [Opitutaceae bacterium]
MNGEKTTIEFDDRIVRMFLLASIVWGAVGMLVGVLIATQLNYWQANFDMSWLTFGRLRPLHTNAVIFAFVGNTMFAGIYHSTQRLCKVRLASSFLSNLHFWGWQLIIVSAAISLPLGFSRGKEYAELIWPINIVVVFIWVVFGINFFWTLARRNEKSLYVAIWFYIATIVTVAVLYIVNHLSIPTSILHSYPIFGGVQDALVQWWYGHNAVAFFLTTPILGIMYYYLPKAAERPVYSYRLSVVHFWSLVFLYIWAGPHHLLHSALPQWLQSLAMVFSLMLWAPSWGGMLNGLLTLRGAWDKLRTDPVLKFFAAAITFYGMVTFGGPLLSIKSVNAVGHYTDWIIGHVHAGTLGWNGFTAAGMIYWMVPRLWNTKLYSVSLANMHFWLGLVGILLYVASMWISGITQGLMLNGTTEGGQLLANPNFIDTLTSIRPLMGTRVVGGGLYLIGWLMLSWNVWMTIRSGSPVNGTMEVLEEKPDPASKMGLFEAFVNPPVIYSTLIVVLACSWGFSDGIGAIVSMVALFAVVLISAVHLERGEATWGQWYEKLLANSFPFTILVIFSVLIGGIVQIVPLVTVTEKGIVDDRMQVPYTPLELAGRDIYVSEGCYTCHSQMIRPFVGEILRYGDYSRLGESIYDYPFQWGSRRIGPDLARVGGKYTDDWHFNHMLNPRSVSTGSNMPNYPWLLEKDIDVAVLPRKLDVQRTLGVPYPELTPKEIQASVTKQSAEIVERLLRKGVLIAPEKEIVAVIAYLQKLGQSETVGSESQEKNQSE